MEITTEEIDITGTTAREIDITEITTKNENNRYNNKKEGQSRPPINVAPLRNTQMAIGCGSAGAKPHTLLSGGLGRRAPFLGPV